MIIVASSDIMIFELYTGGGSDHVDAHDLEVELVIHISLKRMELGVSWRWASSTPVRRWWTAAATATSAVTAARQISIIA